VIGQGARLVAAGLGLGLLLALATLRLLQTMLLGVAALDAATLAATTTGLAGVALLAAFLPARRAARTEPAIVLREA